MAKGVAKADAGKVPAYLDDLNVRDVDNFDSTDIVVPQIKLMQGTSKELTLYNEAKQGEFWHTGADLCLGPQIKFIPCYRRKRFLLMAPLDDGQGILARADDGRTWDQIGKWVVKIDKRATATWEITNLDVEKSGLDKWGTFDPEDPNSPPAATMIYDYLVMLLGHEHLGPASMLLARSAIKKVRKGLNDKIAMHKTNGRPMQALMFTAQAVPDVNGAGQNFHNWQFRSSGFAEQEQYEQARRVFDTMQHYVVQDEGTAAHIDASSSDVPADGDVPF